MGPDIVSYLHTHSAQRGNTRAVARCLPSQQLLRGHRCSWPIVPGPVLLFAGWLVQCPRGGDGGAASHLRERGIQRSRRAGEKHTAIASIIRPYQQLWQFLFPSSLSSLLTELHERIQAHLTSILEGLDVLWSGGKLSHCLDKLCSGLLILLEN